MTGPIFCIVMLSLAAGSDWEYQQVARFADPGPCDSAAQIGDRFCVGCRLGVWVGKGQDWRLGISCTSREGWPNRVRVLDEYGFIASTPCGLFRVLVDGRIERLALPAVGALATDGRGRAVVASDEALWWLRPETGEKSQIPGFQAETTVEQLELQGDLLLVREERTWVVSMSQVARSVIHDQDPTTLLAPGRIMTVTVHGRIWVHRPGDTFREASVLALRPGERVTGVISLGKRALVLTSIRWMLWDDGPSISGELPVAAGRPVLVRGDSGSEVPWMVVDGQVFRPVFRREPTGDPAGCHRLGAFRRALDRVTVLPPPPEGSCWAGWLPRITIAVHSSPGRDLGSRGQADILYRRQRDVGLTLNFVWDLESAAQCETGALHQLRRDVVNHRRHLLDAIAGWHASWRKLCSQAVPLADQEIEAFLEVVRDHL